MLVSMPTLLEKNLAVLHVYDLIFLSFQIISHQLWVTDVAQAFGTFSPCLITLSLSLSHPPTVSLFHLKSRPYPFQTSYFLKGRTLSSAPYLTKLMSVSYQLPFFYPRLSQCITTPMFALLVLFQKNKKDVIFHGYRTDNTQRDVVCKSERVF